MVDDFAQVVAAGNPVLNLAEDFANLVFDSIRAAGALAKTVEVGKELLVDEIAEIIACHRLVVIELIILVLGCGPAFPSVGLVENVGVFLLVQRGLVGLVLFQTIEVLQEQEPGGLFGVVEFSGAPGLFPKDIINIFKGLFEHRGCNPEGESCKG